jgi:endonuclease VIII-like 1
MLYTLDRAQVLAFVDTRRFGGWEVAETFDTVSRGPDPTLEFDSFRSHICKNLAAAAFDKPICEVLLEQSYFNGIGNYLRAEILHRAGVKPFERARDALLPCFTRAELVAAGVGGAGGEGPAPTKATKRDAPAPTASLLTLCRDVPLEVVSMGLNYFAPDLVDAGFDKFERWLRVYQKGRNLVDKHGRTIWFEGEPGPLAPRVKKVRRATMNVTPEEAGGFASPAPAADDAKQPAATKPAATSSTAAVSYVLLSAKRGRGGRAAGSAQPPQAAPEASAPATVPAAAGAPPARSKRARRAEEIEDVAAPAAASKRAKRSAARR